MKIDDLDRLGICKGDRVEYSCVRGVDGTGATCFIATLPVERSKSEAAGLVSNSRSRAAR